MLRTVFEGAKAVIAALLDSKELVIALRAKLELNWKSLVDIPSDWIIVNKAFIVKVLLNLFVWKFYLNIISKI